MAATQVPETGIILYSYDYSPYARKIMWYLELRGIPYAKCKQLDRLPQLELGGRPDLLALGVTYRRIPALAIGRDVYCDTHMIIQKLEQRYPNNKLGTSTPEGRLIERLLERWTNDSMFWNVAACIPPDSPALKDPKWTADRQQMTGIKWSPEKQAKGRPEALSNVRDGFNLLEHTILSDGRKWLLNGSEPSLADIQAIWPFNWVAPFIKEIASPQTHPKVFAWFQRFAAAVKAANGKPAKVSGEEALKQVLGADLAEQGGRIDEGDPLKLVAGMPVSVFPTDAGSGSKDSGRLVDLTPDEVTIGVQPPSQPERVVHVHFPRWRFRIVAGAPESKM